MAYYSRYYRTTGFTLPLSYTTMPYTTHDFSSDSDTAYNKTTGVFTAPEAGDYVIYATYSVSKSWNQDSGAVPYIDKNGNPISQINASASAAATFASGETATVIATLALNDTIEIKARSDQNDNPSTNGTSTTDALFIYKINPGLGDIFRASRATAFSATSTFATMPFTTEQTDTSSAYNSTTGVFTTPTTGIYDISAIASMSATWSTNKSVKVGIYKNGSLVKYVPNGVHGAGTQTVTGQVRDLLSLTAGDTVDIRVAQDLTTSVNTIADGTKNVFSGYRIA